MLRSPGLKLRKNKIIDAKILGASISWRAIVWEERKLCIQVLQEVSWKYHCNKDLILKDIDAIFTSPVRKTVFAELHLFRKIWFSFYSNLSPVSVMKWTFRALRYITLIVRRVFPWGWWCIVVTCIDSWQAHFQPDRSWSCQSLQALDSFSPLLYFQYRSEAELSSFNPAIGIARHNLGYLNHI